ncbi:hypothetical protein LPJ59_000423 [Coemansia sp. RSA 2399]|nr:hypothetical protein LPJ59_000423 [Coemansia sp. RSA 2399]
MSEHLALTPGAAPSTALVQAFEASQAISQGSDGIATQTSEPVLCQNTPTQAECSDEQIPVLVVSGLSCNWECQTNPHYVRATNSKPTVIGGSVGAVAFVLLVLVAILTFSQCRKKRRQRAVYNKDTADLASELSDIPLLQANDGQQHLSRRISFSSARSAIGSRLRMFIGLDSGSSARSNANTAGILTPYDSGAELLMDISGRVPDDDPTLASVDGAAAPFRQEKTADAYSLLLEFSEASGTNSLPYRVEYSASVVQCPPPKPTHALQKQRSMARRLQRPVSTGCVELDLHEIRLLNDYEAAKYTGDAVIESMRKSTFSTPDSNAAFDPFNTVPGIRSTPYCNDSRSIASRRTSSKSISFL